ncbi:MAG: LysR family transcriptional regulator [Pigmentiphaga sp.]|uniref:LysR family transcriptional regulator n=1 Tax=Pigmentiphaga sp. TaxID=1977564 RepID=UPI0029B8B432|nr:LysR family transcriptional regulator [Pigmentiphaga sp.]MDX3907433.1 LysR family transcriptional regulator [Pigmentiphaga sp.]
MGSEIQPADLGFFSTLVSAGSLSAAARELSITTAAVSKRLAQIEARAGLLLVNRTTRRRMSLTPEGELYLKHARRILSEIDDMAELLSGAKASPKGLLRVNATLGFGRRHVAPLVSKFVRAHPDVEVQLQLSVHPPAQNDDFDVSIRFGAPPETRVIAKHLGPNHRVLCASPAYIAKHGMPRTLEDLSRHNCIGLRQGDKGYGIWLLAHNRAEKNEAPLAVKIRGNLSTNDGEIAVNWALEGHGIILRAEWDVGRYLRSGRLVRVMPDFHVPDSDLYAVYPPRHQLVARVRDFVEFVAKEFSKQRHST